LTFSASRRALVDAFAAARATFPQDRPDLPCDDEAEQRGHREPDSQQTPKVQYWRARKQTTPRDGARSVAERECAAYSGSRLPDGTPWVTVFPLMKLFW